MAQMESGDLAITYNNHPMVVKRGSTLQDFLHTHTVKTESCVIFVNEKFVSHELYNSYELHNRDAIVKVDFMPGG